MKTPFTHSDLNTHDKVSRLINKIENRLTFFHDQIAYRQKSPLYEIYLNEYLKWSPKYKNYATLLRALRNINNDNKAKDIYIEAYRETKDWPEKWKHAKKVLTMNKPNYEKVEESWILNMLTDSNSETIAAGIRSKIQIELDRAIRKEWYIIFGTLTLNGEWYNKVFKKGSNHWRYYIQNMKRDLGAQIYGSISKSKGKDYFEYIAVMEEGKIGRIHMHLLLIMKEQPNCKDPNFGNKDRNNLEIKELEEKWPYGISQFKAVRWSRRDPWGKIGWVWPNEISVDTKTGATILSPIKESTVGQLKSYLTKYILKEAQQKAKETKTWRTKSSRTMGIKEIKEIIKTMEDEKLEAMVRYQKAPITIEINNEIIPHKIIRYQAVKELVRRYKKKKHPLKSSAKNIRLKMLMKLSTQKTADCNQQKTGRLLAKLYKGTEDSEGWLKHYIQGKNEIENSTIWSE